MLDAMMEIMWKYLLDELIREVVAHDFDTWWKKAVRTIMVWLIIIDYVEISIVKFVFVSGIIGESAALGVAEGSGREGLMVGIK